MRGKATELSAKSKMVARNLKALRNPIGVASLFRNNRHRTIGSGNRECRHSAQHNASCNGEDKHAFLH